MQTHTRPLRQHLVQRLPEISLWRGGVRAKKLAADRGVKPQWAKVSTQEDQFERMTTSNSNICIQTEAYSSVPVCYLVFINNSLPVFAFLYVNKTCSPSLKKNHVISLVDSCICQCWPTLWQEDSLVQYVIRLCFSHSLTITKWQFFKKHFLSLLADILKAKSGWGNVQRRWCPQAQRQQCSCTVGGWQKEKKFGLDWQDT